MFSAVIEVCDKLPGHWDGWWIPHVLAAGVCALMRVFGGSAGKLVGYFLAGLWGAVWLSLEWPDEISTPADVVHELGLWTYALHVFGMLLPLVAVAIAGAVRGRTDHVSARPAI